MATYFAVCNANGPISKKINAESIEDAVSQFEAMDSRSLIDDCSTDAEDDLDIEDAAGMSEDEFAATLEAAGCECVRDMAEVVNGYLMQSYHVQGGWMLWHKVGKITYVVKTECGSLELEADSIEKAKENYTKKHGFDFSDCENIEGSWYYIGNFETGEELESCGNAPD